MLLYRPPGQDDKDNSERLYVVVRGLEGTLVRVGDYNLPGVTWTEAGQAEEVREFLLKHLLINSGHSKSEVQLI